MFGYELTRRKKFPNFDNYLSGILEFYEIDLVLDVGANVGDYSQGIYDRGYCGEVMLFEPNPRLFPELDRVSQHHSNWEVYPIALGRDNGEQELIITKKSALASFRQPSEYSLNKLIAEVDIEQRVTVQVRRLDDVLREADIDITKRNVLLKLDTQGFDLEVCGGAMKTLPHIPLLQIELSFIALYEDIPSYLEALKFLGDISFIPSGLFPIWRDATTQAMVEADCVLVNTSI